MLHGDVVALLLLNAPGDGGSHQAGEPGIFGIIFKVSAAQGIAVDVDGWSKPVGAAILLHLPEDGVTHLLHKLDIPALGQRRGDREGGGILIQHPILLRITHQELLHKSRQGIKGRHSQFHGLDLSVLGNRRLLLDTKTGRAVAQSHIGKSPIPEFRGGIAHRTGQMELLFTTEEADTHHNIHHFFHRQSIQNGFYIRILPDRGRLVGVSDGGDVCGSNAQPGQPLGNGLISLNRSIHFLQRLLQGANMLMPGDDDLLCKADRTHHSSIPGGIAQPEDVVAGFQHEGCIGFPVAGNSRHGEGQCHDLLLTRCQNVSLGEGH